jgi:predicted GNAT family acetyltransferase
MAYVLDHARRLAPTVSLYVNDFNSAALRMYQRLGMNKIATLATVLF